MSLNLKIRFGFKIKKLKNLNKTTFYWLSSLWKKWTSEHITMNICIEWLTGYKLRKSTIEYKKRILANILTSLVVSLSLSYLFFMKTWENLLLSLIRDSKKKNPAIKWENGHRGLSISPVEGIFSQEGVRKWFLMTKYINFSKR